MYESYAWPGAHSLKSDIKLFITWFKIKSELLFKKISDAEKKVSVGDNS